MRAICKLPQVDFEIARNREFDLRALISALEAENGRLHTLRPEADYHEDMGPVLWWIWPICEPPYCDQPGDSDWPDYHTHFSPLPNCAALNPVITPVDEMEDRAL